MEGSIDLNLVEVPPIYAKKLEFRDFQAHIEKFKFDEYFVIWDNTTHKVLPSYFITQQIYFNLENAMNKV